jgi:hypothetical protein
MVNHTFCGKTGELQYHQTLIHDSKFLLGFYTKDQYFGTCIIKKQNKFSFSETIKQKFFNHRK